MNRIALHLLLLALLPPLWIGCRVSGRLVYNKEDMQHAQELAERYLGNLRDQQFELAVALLSESSTPKITAQGLKDDLDGRFGGGVIQTWQLKDSKIIQESPRRILLLYQVQSTAPGRDFEITTELAPNPWHWIIASVAIANDEATIAHAKHAQPTADLFLQRLQGHSFDRAFKLLSPTAQKMNSVTEWRSYWLRLEEDGGGITGWELKQFYDTKSLVDGKRRPYTMLAYKLRSPKGYITALLTMVEAEETWEIEGLQLRDDITF
jgi:hypothetical protein